MTQLEVGAGSKHIALSIHMTQSRAICMLCTQANKLENCQGHRMKIEEVHSNKPQAESVCKIG